MGCDINAWIEYRETEDSFWDCLGEFEIGRYPTLFAFLGHEGKAFSPFRVHFESKGLPDDDIDYSVTVGYEIRSSGNECHHHSWLSCKEFKKVHDVYGRHIREVAAIYAAMKALDEICHEVRFIYWFDN